MNHKLPGILLFILILPFILNSFSGCRSASPLPAKETSPEEKPLRHDTIVTFRVDPQEFFRDNNGYTGLEYRTFDELWQKKKQILDSRNSPEEDYKKAARSVPGFGSVTIHIGRQDLMHANTRWYSYSVSRQGKIIFSRNGEEGIPNVKGRDGNWWNIIEIALPEEIKDSIEVKVTDKKTAKDYLFSVTREENVIVTY